MKQASTSASLHRHGSRWAPALLLLALGLGMAAPVQADRGWRGHGGGGHGGGHVGGYGGSGWGGYYGYHGYGWGGGIYGALPAIATVLTIGALTYWVADGVYYRAVPSGGYEVVPAPVGVAQPPAVVANSSRVFIYPRNAQTREQQASDEYQCHQWAVGQTGFDPSLGGAADPDSRQNYRRAQLACLDGRGYTVK